MFGWRLTIVGLVILLSTANKTFAVDQSWYFTAGEIKIAYRYQQSFGRRLRHPLNPQDCYFGKTEFTASFQGKPFLAPCRFIHRTTNHLKVMLEIGAARYVFPLDADHAHLAVPVELWREKYSRTDGAQLLPQILHDPALIALYRRTSLDNGFDGFANRYADQAMAGQAQRTRILRRSSRQDSSAAA